ncbi:molybdate ABC transporter substrate-binding protein [Zavarzinia sp. CC-PAN008]|uniref:molybdate ABC transporter substrate-binding protein n=1 Tax=Zavarzinia sp. CC-PAN008 TaxID=3243332 RepID=UPI003F744A17
MNMARRPWLHRALAVVVLGLGLSLGAQARADDVTVFAAASLKNALDAAAAAWGQQTGNSVTISYAASSALAKQIEQGAPADLFISADVPWMDYVAEKSLIKADTRVDLLGNSLVLVAPAASTASVTIAPGMGLGALIGTGRIAMGDVAAVPAGKYGKAALESLGEWAAVEPKVAMAENVRAALALVARGEVPFGIVYATDAVSEPKVKVLDTFPAGSHPPIVYPLAVLAEAKTPAATAFADWLRTAPAGAYFKAQGFQTLAAPATN